MRILLHCGVCIVSHKTDGILMDTRLANQVWPNRQNLLAGRDMGIRCRRNSKEVPGCLSVQQVDEHAVGELDDCRSFALGVSIPRSMT